MLVKWQRFPHEEDTWEPKKNLHPEALEDYEWKKRLPFALSELLELPPHIPWLESLERRRAARFHGSEQRVEAKRGLIVAHQVGLATGGRCG